MANQEHLNILKQGVEIWNGWRMKNPAIAPDLSDADLSGANLCEADLRRADFSRAVLFDTDLKQANPSAAKLVGANLNEADLMDVNLSHAYLPEANLSGAILGAVNLSFAEVREADLSRAYLREADLRGTDLSSAILFMADLYDAILSGANLSGANLNEADLIGVNLSGAYLRESDFSNTRIGQTTFGNSDLSAVKGLQTVRHLGPSTIGIDTLYQSAGKIPDVFLRGCGLPEEFIHYLPSLIGTRQAIQFYSCFISYSTRDEEFAQRLYSRMRDAQLRVWFAPEDIKGGEKLHEQIDRAIQIHDRLLIVLSEHSMQSEWVMTEIRKARKAEIKEGRRKLFPIRLSSFDAIRAWECFDADAGKDLAVEVREYFIPDFSQWKDHDSFKKSFERLLKDLQAAEATKKTE